jgi:glycosyltransferase involved in cell wall biosynthesis
VSERVVLLRGLSVAPWDLAPYELLEPDYDVSVVLAPGNIYGTGDLALERRPARSVSSLLPPGRLGQLATRAVGERFIGLGSRLEGAAIVHAAELGNWYSAQAARLKRRLGFKLVVTTWETLPLRSAYRNVRTRPYARDVLAATDRFLATTERARSALLLEGAPSERITICPPGIDLARFALAREPKARADGRHLILSVGRLVWEKGHQDLLRALALLRLRGRDDFRAVVIGDGPEGERLRAVAADFGLGAVVEFRATLPYGEMPALYAQASCLVLASLPVRFWEEQFGMVLAEAMAGQLSIVASSSGAIPEVLGSGGVYVTPGDWVGLADRLEQGPLSQPPGTRSGAPAELLERFSTSAAAARLRAAYGELLARDDDARR